MKPMLAALWIVGAVLLLLSWGSSLLVGRRREIGNQIVIGVSRGRIAWQFMLETLLLNLVGFAVGMVVGAFAVKPLATKLADGNAVSVPGNLDLDCHLERSRHDCGPDGDRHDPRAAVPCQDAVCGPFLE